MNENQPYQKKEGTTGLWAKQSPEGKIYWTGRLTLNEKDYWVNLYKNDFHSGLPEEKKPLMNLKLKPVDQQ